MIKQHCDICDGVIPNVESYRTVFFGRGTNPKVNTGYDPTIVCKKCWNRMLDGVGAGDLVKVLPDKSVEETMVKTEIKTEERIDNLVKDIVDGITGKDKSCATCRFGESLLSDEPCKHCTGKDRWTQKRECPSPSIKCIDCDYRDDCNVYTNSEEDE